MVVKQQTGHGFKGLSDYLLHDKGAGTAVRVAWTHQENLATDRAQSAWRQMAYTAGHAEALKRQAGKKRTGRKAEKPVLHLVLSWAQEEAPGREEMIAAGKEVLDALGLQDRQALFVCHNDRQPHLHILANRVDPQTGIMNRLSRSKRRLSAWALQYEARQGEIRCEKRLENNRALHLGEKPRHRDPAIRDAWEGTDSGLGFAQALAAKGYVLARGNRRIVVVDPYGKAVNPARVLYGVKAADIQARLGDLDPARLPGVEAVRKRSTAPAQAEGRTVRQAFNRTGRGSANGNGQPALERRKAEPGKQRWPRPFEGIRAGRMDSARVHFREAGAGPPGAAASGFDFQSQGPPKGQGMGWCIR